MYKKQFKSSSPLVFRRFSRKYYALFRCVGKELVVGTLSVSTLTYAKADGVSTDVSVAVDSLARQEKRLDEVSVMGNRASLTDMQSARIVSVISREDIAQSAAETVNDILKTALGVDVRQRGGFGVQTDISINGGTFDQIAVLLNGIPISNPQTGHHSADFPVSLSDVERIEILEGSSSRLLGASAFNGAINIVTRSVSSTSLSFLASGGSYGTLDAGASVNAKTRFSGHMLSGGYTRSDGGIEHSDFQKQRAYYSGSVYLTNAVITGQAGYSARNYGANTFYSSSYDNQYEENRRLMASLSAKVYVPHTSLVIEPSVYGVRDFDHYQLIRYRQGAANGENYHRVDAYGGALNAHGSWLLGTTAFGVDVRHEGIWSTAHGDLKPEDSWKNIIGSSRVYDHGAGRTNTGLFLEHSVILNRFSISAGVLGNHNTGLKGGMRFYPGVDVAYRPNPHWKLALSWNQALRMPTFTDLYISNPIQQGDANLRPEKNTTYKASGRYVSGIWQVSASVFCNQGRDMIDWVYETSESKTYHALNIGRLRNIGVSGEVAMDFRKYFSNPFVTRLQAGYAYMHQQHETAQHIYKSLYALEYLRHKVTGQLDHHIWGPLYGHWTFRWQRRMNGYSPYGKLDAKISWQGRHHELYVQVDNLTNRRYYDLGGIRQPGIWVMAGGKVSLNL